MALIAVGAGGRVEKEPKTDASHRGESARPGRSAGEAEPDARFTFANERTFLAWSRLALTREALRTTPPAALP